MKQIIIVLFIGIFFMGASHASSAVIGDINGDGYVGLEEALFALQVAAGQHPGFPESCILNGGGVWETAKNYTQCDVLSYMDNFYVALVSNISNVGNAPNVDNATWALLPLKGEKGDQGPQGPAGTSSWIDGWGVVLTFNNVGIGTTNPGSDKLYVAGNASFTGIVQFSDERWKKNIEPYGNTLAKVTQLQGVAYEWNIEQYPDQGFEEGRQIGFIAQDVEKVIPELVKTGKDGYKSVSYSKLSVLLVEAVKELKTENEALKILLCQDRPEATLCN